MATGRKTKNGGVCREKTKENSPKLAVVKFEVQSPNAFDGCARNSLFQYSQATVRMVAHTKTNNLDGLSAMSHQCGLPSYPKQVLHEETLLISEKTAIQMSAWPCLQILVVRRSFEIVFEIADARTVRKISIILIVKREPPVLANFSRFFANIIQI